MPAEHHTVSIEREPGRRPQAIDGNGRDADVDSGGGTVHELQGSESGARIDRVGRNSVVAHLIGRQIEVTELGPLIVTTSCLVLAVNPIRVLIQRSVDHLLRGDRNDPHTSIARLGRTIVSTYDAGQLLPAVVAEIAASLRLPYVAVMIDGEDGVLAQAHTGRSQLLPEKLFPMTYQGLRVGQLVVGKTPCSAISPATSVSARRRSG